VIEEVAVLSDTSALSKMGWVDLACLGTVFHFALNELA
jgi:hypothetical protein